VRYVYTVNPLRRKVSVNTYIFVSCS